MTSKLVVNTIEADTGISSVSFGSSISLSSTSKFFFGAAGIDIGADTNINRPASGVLGFNINSSEKARIDSSGHIQVNTTSKGLATYGEDLTIASPDHGGITIRTGTGHKGTVYFSDATSGAGEYRGSIQYDHADNSLRLAANSSVRLFINSSGLVNIGAGSSASGLAPLLHLHKNASNDSAYLHITNNDTGITNNDGFLLGINPPGDCLIFNKDSTPIRFATAGTERLRISSAGFVGINSAIPRTYLQVSKGSSGYNPGNPTAFNSNNVLACFENSDDVEVTLLSPNNKKNIINFGDTDNVANSSIEYDHSVNHLIFKVNGGSERFRINNSGAFGLNGTNYGTSGQVLKSGGTNGAPTWGSAGGHTETYARVVFGAVYDTNSGYIVHNITSGSSNGITIDTTNERVTPTVAGTYLVIYNAHWGGLHSSGATYYNRITKNGSEYISSNFSAYDPGTHMHTVMTTIPMNGSSDYIQFEFYENKSGAAAYVNHKSRAVVILLDT